MANKRLVTSGTLNNAFARRSVVIGALQGGLGLLLSTRMGYIAVAENERYNTLAESNRVNLTLIPPRRGWILDRNGAPLASNRADFRVDLIPERVVDADRTLAELGAILSLSEAELRDLRDKIEKARGFAACSGGRARSMRTAMPRSACGCPTCRASCLSAAIRGSIRPDPRSATSSATSVRPQPRTTKRNAIRC